MNQDTPPLERLQDLLRELLQLDLADLDFGIYRLLRIKHDEVTAFLEEQLPSAVHEAFASATDAERTAVLDEVETLAAQIRDDIAEDALNADGSVAEEYRDVNAKAIRELIDEYEAARDRLDSIRTTDAQKTDVFNHLYDFFRRYYEDGDFIPKRRYGAREHYAVPYNGEETLLHWANRGQHYVKNAEVFKDYAFTVEGDLIAEPARVRFVLTEASTPPGDTKGDTRYFFPRPDSIEWDQDSRTLVLPFEYRLPFEAEAQRLGRTRVQETILDESLDELREAIADGALRAALMPEVNEDGDDSEPLLLVRHLRKFVRRNTADYFIHRDLQGFLERELEFYIKDQVLHLADLDGNVQNRLRMLRVLRAIGGQVIAFLAQIEDVQKRLFEKRKFVLRTDYLVLMKAVPEQLWPTVLANERQVSEWVKLFHIDPEEDLFDSGGDPKEDLLANHPGLLINTAHFDEGVCSQILESFPNLEDATGGILVQGENYQALRLLEPRFRNEVKCIYIDPPYNTGSDDFLYKDRYKHSSWVAMIEERLQLARRVLDERGAIFISVDDNEQPNLRRVGDSTFGSANFIDTVIWQKVYAPKSTARHLSASHDFIEVYAKSGAVWTPNLLPRTAAADARYTNRDDDPRGAWKPSDLSARNYYSKGEYEIASPSGKTFSNPEGTYWRVSKEKFLELDEDDRIWWGEDGDNVPALKRFLSEVKSGLVPQTLWRYKDVGHTQEAKKELMAIVDFPRTEDVLQTVKPTRLIRRIVHLASDPGDWVMDFFAGSGTTGHAVINHSRENGETPRRFILVEQGQYFGDLVIQRIARALFAAEWKDRKPLRPAGNDPSQLLPLVKILHLESYEDALHNLITDTTLTKAAARERATEVAQGDDSYRLRYLARLPLEASESSLNVEALEHPFQYELETLTDDGPQPQLVDLVETFNLIYGLRVRRIQTWDNEQEDRTYKAVIGDDPDGQRTLVLWRDMEELDPAVERTFLEQRISEADPPYDVVLINGDSTVPGVRSLDPIFKARMMEGESS